MSKMQLGPMGMKQHEAIEKLLMEDLQRQLMSKLLIASNEIAKKRKPTANYIHLTEPFIQSLADENGITLDEMVGQLENLLKPEEERPDRKYKMFDTIYVDCYGEKIEDWISGIQWSNEHKMWEYHPKNGPANILEVDIDTEEP